MEHGYSMPIPETPANKCPDHIDCARRGRHFCKHGSSHCGPCLDLLEEDEGGHCVPQSRHYTHHHEIDLLSSVISKQQESEAEQPGSNQNSLSKSTTPEPATSRPSPPKHTTESSERKRLVIEPHSSRNMLLVLMISLCVIVGSMALIIATVCWVRLHRESHLAQKVDYPAFQDTAPSRNHASSGDKNLAHSAQMYHYQHQKQQMRSMQKSLILEAFQKKKPKRVISPSMSVLDSLRLEKWR
ncbi:hypothetical protein DNTS_025914 [Danionella cerebrum]|uniref:Neural proliferation differentiation and control protein 1 n=1 Tax=Danionella cerebrum TaxID=2873325 RepID=A0A553MWW5_9TELE|nr:hypothetical protein DNTS_025914 [Danionella translucida]